MVQTNRNIWAEIERVQAKYNSLNLSEQVDYDKFRLYSIIANSTAIEGSTLSELDVQLLFDEGVTKRGTIIIWLRFTHGWMAMAGWRAC